MEPTHEHPNITTFRGWLSAVERQAVGDELAAFFTPDACAIELPNQLFPGGATRDVAALCAAAERGRHAVANSRFEVRRIITEGDELAAQLEWSATLKVGFGERPIGATIRASIACFVRFRAGLIAENRSYDCYFPPGA